MILQFLGTVATELSDNGKMVKSLFFFCGLRHQGLNSYTLRYVVVSGIPHHTLLLTAAI